MNYLGNFEWKTYDNKTKERTGDEETTTTKNEASAMTSFEVVSVETTATTKLTSSTMEVVTVQVNKKQDTTETTTKGFPTSVEVITFGYKPEETTTKEPTTTRDPSLEVTKTGNPCSKDYTTTTTKPPPPPIPPPTFSNRKS